MLFHATTGKKYRERVTIELPLKLYITPYIRDTSILRATIQSITVVISLALNPSKCEMANYLLFVRAPMSILT